jgi:hypothetical protein
MDGIYHPLRRANRIRVHGIPTHLKMQHTYIMRGSGPSVSISIEEYTIPVATKIDEDCLICSEPYVDEDEGYDKKRSSRRTMDMSLASYACRSGR